MMVEQNKCIFYMMIFDITCNSIEKEFDRDHINNKKILKAKRQYNGDDGTNCYDKEITKLGSNHTCLEAIYIDFFKKKMNNFICGCF